MSRKKSFRKSLRESFRRLRRGRSQRNQPTTSAAATSSPDSTSPTDASGPRKAFGRSTATTTGVRTFSAPSNDTAQQAAAAHRNLLSGERQVEPKVELSSIVKCITLCSAVITSDLSLFKPSFWVGTNSGQVLVYAIDLPASGEHEQRLKSESGNSDQQTMPAVVSGQRSSTTNTTSSDSSSLALQQTQQKPIVARLTKEIQLKHKAPIVAIFTSPEAPVETKSSTISDGNADQQTVESATSTPEKNASGLFDRASNERSEQQQVSSEANEIATSGANEQQRPQSPQQGLTTADKSSPSKIAGSLQQQPRVLICSEEQFKVFILPNLKPFCKFKLTAHEGLRAKKISITQFLKPSPYPAINNSIGNSTQQSTTAPLNNNSSSSNKLQSTTTLNSSKSLQSFATQTSPSVSPVPPESATSNQDATEQQQQQQLHANGSGNKSSSMSSKQAESNNNSLLAPNNNATSSGNTGTITSKQQDKELLNAKFGAKVNSSSSFSGTATTTAAATNPSDRQQIGSDSLTNPPSDGVIFEPYMVCMSNQGDCAIYSVPDLKRQAQIQVCKREDVNGITSAMLTNYGEGYYLRSSSNFLRFSISSQRVLRVLSVV